MYDPGALQVFDPILTNFSVGFQDQNLYGERLFPVTRVNTRNGVYRVFDRSNWLMFRDHRAPGTVANEVSGRVWSQDTFQVKEHSLQAPVYDEENEELNALGGIGQPNLGGAISIQPETDAVNLITRSIMLGFEQAVANTIRNAANYAANHKVTLSGTSQWSDYSGTSDPVSDLRTAMRRVYLDTRQWPNTMIIPFDAVGVIENNPKVVARYTYTSVFDPNAWKQILGLPAGVADNLNVFVVDSMYNSADNLDVAPTMTGFWGQDVWVGVVNPGDGQNIQTFGKAFARPYPNGDIRPTDRWREEARKTDVVRVSYRYDLKIVNSLAGYLIKSAVAAIP
jgi:hypothetical protein